MQRAHELPEQEVHEHPNAGAFIRRLPAPVSVRALLAHMGGSAQIVGDPDRPVRGLGALSPGHVDTLTFCDASDARAPLAATQASVIAIGSAAPTTPNQTLIVVADPRQWFIHAVEALLPGSARPREPANGIHPTARVHAEAEVSPGAAIAEGVVVGAGTRVGPGAVIYADCTIGANCCIGPGAVIGWVGLAYHQARDGHREFFPHLGGVRIGDWVDIGANACVCRGMLSDTTIGRAAKIGSLVYLSHGTTIGDNAWVSASAAVAGHSTLGANALLGIGAVIIDNIELAPGVIVGGGGVVTRAAAAGEKLVGVPARHTPALRRFGPTPRED
jgi:UDP-3-O-[3-hydroxymyristoyl] glucosamine N-acyltransferase